MTFFPPGPTNTVSRKGAKADSVLCGTGKNNQGLRLRIAEDQPGGSDGPVRGPFVLLDVGTNRHSDALLPLLNQVTDARQVLDLIRRQHPACVSVVNANLLTVEEAVPAVGGPRGARDAAVSNPKF